MSHRFVSFFTRVLIALACQVAIAEAADPDQNAYYNPQQVQSIELQIEDEDWESMHAALPQRIYVPATFRWKNQDIVVRKVGVRFKGNSSSNPHQPFKRSFLIKFDEYEKKQRFLGLRRVAFDNGIQFGSLFSEPIITDILAKTGVTTHRSNYAKVDMNGKYIGVYVNVERIDEVFLQRQFGTDDGLLFKCDEGGPGANLQYLGDNINIYKRAFEPKSKAAKRGYEDLVHFLKMIDRSTPEEFEAKVQSQFETEEFLKLMAVMLFSGAFDQLTGWNPHNYYLHCQRDGDKASSRRWRYLPWDLDVGFSANAFGRIRVLEDWHAAWPIPPSPSPNPLLERIVESPTLLESYRRVANQILEEHFRPEQLCRNIDAKYALIRDDLANDPFPHRRATQPNDRDYDDIVATMKDFVRKRYASAKQQLERPGARPEFEHRQSHPPQELARKVQRIQRMLPQLQRKGVDVQDIHAVLRKLGPNLERQNWLEANVMATEALEKLDQKMRELKSGG